MTVFSIHPLRDIQDPPGVERSWPMIDAAVCPAGFARCAELVAVHVPRPGRRWTGLRYRVFAEVAARARAGRQPVIVVGDFNSTPWSPAFRRMMRRGGLRDGNAILAALSPTWLSRTAPFGLEIDHILMAGEIYELRRQVGPAFGSDHFSIRARLAADLGALAPSASAP